MGATDPGARARKRTGRRVGPTVSHQHILQIAREQFRVGGYEGATMRAIAVAAGVDAALIHHFFRTKERLFAAAIADAVTPPDLAAVMVGRPSARAERLVHAFLQHWDDPGIQLRLVAVLRSASSHEGAAQAVIGLLGDAVLGPLVATLGRPQATLRAALIGAQLVGLATARYVLAVEPLASLPAADIVAVAARPIQAVLTRAP